MTRVSPWYDLRVWRGVKHQEYINQVVHPTLPNNMHATKSNVTVKFLTPTSCSAAKPVSLQCRCVVYFIVIENTNLRKRERGIPHQANWYTRHLLGWLKVRKGTPPTSARYLASGDSTVPVSVLYRRVKLLLLILSTAHKAWVAVWTHWFSRWEVASYQSEPESHSSQP